MLTDTELVASARNGDAPALGALLERHRAGMHAAAMGVLGWGSDAEDAVQDAMLVAMARLGELRDPAAVGGWLRAIARNGARMRVRHTPALLLPLPDGDVPATTPTPEETLDEHALSDWVWHAFEQLSEPLQTAVLLRYFTGVSSYAQIAELCGVPLGTVRSRLAEARRRLGEALRATAAAAHDDATTISKRGRETAEYLLSSAVRGEFERTLRELATPDVILRSPQGLTARGRGPLVRIMDHDLESGVRQRLRNVTAGRRISVMECDLLSPPWDPEHCPPGVVWLMAQQQGRISEIRLLHPSGAPA